jgi:hypothetical protein
MTCGAWCLSWGVLFSLQMTRNPFEAVNENINITRFTTIAISKDFISKATRLTIQESDDGSKLPSHPSGWKAR